MYTLNASAVLLKNTLIESVFLRAIKELFVKGYPSKPHYKIFYLVNSKLLCHFFLKKEKIFSLNV